MVPIYQNNFRSIILLFLAITCSVAIRHFASDCHLLLWNIFALFIVGYSAKKLLTRHTPIATITCDGLRMPDTTIVVWHDIQSIFRTDETDYTDEAICIVLKKLPQNAPSWNLYRMKLRRWYYGAHIRLLCVRDSDFVYLIIQNYTKDCKS